MRAAGDAAVADIVGSLLLVGITVIATVAFSVLVLSYDGPEDRIHAQVQVRVDPGAGGWSTGDESVQVLHLGGEALPREGTFVAYDLDGATSTFRGDALSSAFSDGHFTIGETWRSPSLHLASTTPVEVRVVSGGGTRLVGSGTVTGTTTTTIGACAVDRNPPSATVTASPPDLDARSTGSVTITATIRDDCSGVDPAVTPRLWWRITPAAFQEQAMTDLGGGRWSAAVMPPGGAWGPYAGQTFEHYVAPLSDLGGNTGQTGTSSDLIEPAYTYTYVATLVATAPATANNVDAARSATDGGAEAVLAEGATAGATTTTTATRSGTTTFDVGATGPGRAVASDDQRALLDAQGEYVEVTGFQLPAGTTSVTAVTIGFEGRVHTSAGQSPTARLSYSIGGTQGTTTRSVTMTNTDDQHVTQTVTSDRAWSVSDFNDLRVRVAAATLTNRHIEVDHVYVTVTYHTSTTGHTLHAVADWTGVPAGSTQVVQARYRASGDTFTMDVWNPQTSTWRDCPGVLSSTAPATFTCTLTASELNAGAPRIRLRDSTPDGTGQGMLRLDHLRVGTL